VTTAQAYALIKDSAPYKAGGTIEAAWIRWRAWNPGEATKLLAYLDARVRGQQVTPPKLATKFGLGALALAAGSEPQPEPPPVTRTVRDRKGALAQSVGSLSPDLVAGAGITGVAAQITSVGSDNERTAENVVQLDRQAGRFPGCTILGWGTHGSDPATGYKSDPEAEAAFVARRIIVHRLPAYAADTERHHLFAERDHTDIFLGALKPRVPAFVQLAVVTFAYSPNSPGQLYASNIEACEKHGVTFIGETYGKGPGADRSWGIAEVVRYMLRDGARNPLRLAIGDKDLASDCIELRGLSGVSGVWAFVPEQAGEAILELAKVAL
jgi:hypothetical protein